MNQNFGVFNKVVSVIVPNFNYGKYLDTCIASILSQTYKLLEVIVVDDGSFDESLHILETYSKEVIVLKQENKGVNSARNLGILNSSGSYIALCDSDDYWESDKIEKQLDLIHSKPNLILVGSSVRYFSKETSDLSTKKVLLEGNLAKLYRTKPGVAWIPNAPSSALFYKSAALSIGLFDDNLSGNAEDWEFFARLSHMGDFSSVHKPLVNVRIHGASRSQIDITKWYKDNLKALLALKTKRYYVHSFEYFEARIDLAYSLIKSLIKRTSIYKSLNKVHKFLTKFTSLF